jgi:hypothetical protein
VVGLALIAAGVLVSVGTAQGNEFRVYTCSDVGVRTFGPTIDDPNHTSGWDVGWTGFPRLSLADRCPVAADFVVEVRGEWPMTAGQSVWARWTAATGTEAVRVAAKWGAWSDLNPNRGEGTAQLTVSTDQQGLLSQGQPISVNFGLGGQPVFDRDLSPARWFQIGYTCLDRCSGPVEALYLHLYTAQFDVRDGSSPTGGLLGSAVDAQAWSGVMRFGLNAADVGGGVFRAVVEVDGADALSVPLGGSSATCRDIGPSPDVNEFAAAQPCPLRIDNGSLDIDTAKLPQGQHTVRVFLEDAAGNRTLIFGPVARSIASSGAIGPGSDPALRGAANGDGASDQAALSAHWGRRGQRTRLVSRFGRTHVVRGRLRARDGAPIANAAIDVVSRTTANNATELVKRGGPRTRSDGSWYLVLPRRVSSRDLSFRYRSHLNDTVPTATATVRLRVRAGLRLSIHPRVARRGDVIRFDGRLLGGPLPRGGKQVVLMAHASGGAWVRFNVVRSGRRGRFRATYRFQQPGVARYRFRALSLAEAAYPYPAGGSNVVVVHKR